MKYLIVLFLLFAIPGISEGQNYLPLIHNTFKCKLKYGVEEDIQGVLLRLVLPKDKKSYCAIACVLHNTGIMYDDYSVNEQQVLQLYGTNPRIPKDVLHFCNIRVYETMLNATKLSQYNIQNGCKAMEILMQCMIESKKINKQYYFK